MQMKSEVRGKVLKDPQHRSLWGVGACHLPACGCAHQQGSCPNLIADLFYGGSITYTWLIKSSAIDD